MVIDSKTAFNAAVFIIGIVLLLIHSLDLLLKRNRRKDENSLFLFIGFTILYFILYLIFILTKNRYTSDAFIIGSYTTFYIMNNIEMLLLFFYTLSYVPISSKNKKIVSLVNYSFFATFIVLDIVNIFSHMFFNADNGEYVATTVGFLSQGYQFIAFAIIFYLTVFNKKTSINEKIAFGIYCILPPVAFAIQNLLSGYAVAYLSVIIAIEILFFFVNVKKNIELSNEAKRTKEAEVKLMVSQIQPHFIYNTLSSISTLIKIDPEKAQKGLDSFTEYLRANLTSINETGLVDFENELRHIETYLSLEKIRFDERLNVNLDIQVKDFKVPPLSIQPIVENAVKHGILQKLEGGTINIKTYATPEANIVEISDDGIGFDTKDSAFYKDNHIGISNVKYRLSTMCNAEMTINSVVDKGTIVTVKFYK